MYVLTVQEMDSVETFARTISGVFYAHPPYIIDHIILNHVVLSNRKKIIILFPNNMIQDPMSQKAWSNCIELHLSNLLNEPHRNKTNKMTCAPSEDSDQPGHPPSLIRIFAVRSMGR